MLIANVLSSNVCFFYNDWIFSFPCFYLLNVSGNALFLASDGFFFS
jgi:hypothetical protein